MQIFNKFGQISEKVITNDRKKLDRDKNYKRIKSRSLCMRLVIGN